MFGIATGSDDLLGEAGRDALGDLHWSGFARDAGARGAIRESDGDGFFVDRQGFCLPPHLYFLPFCKAVVDEAAEGE